MGVSDASESERALDKDSSLVRSEISFELHGAKTGNCVRAAIGLAEAGLSFRVRHLNLAHLEHRSEFYRSLNPAAQVPILVSGEPGSAQGVVLTQSSAILFYADQLSPGRILPPSGHGRIRALEAFFYFTADVIAPNGAAFRLRPEFPKAAGMLMTRSIDAIIGAERFLSVGDFMGGNCFSIADIAAFTIVTAMTADVPWSRLPKLASWRDRIAGRPAVQIGLGAFDAHHPSPPSAPRA